MVLYDINTGYGALAIRNGFMIAKEQNFIGIIKGI